MTGYNARMQATENKLSLSVREVAAELGLSTATIRRHIRRGQLEPGATGAIPSFIAGGSRRVQAEVVDAIRHGRDPWALVDGGPDTLPGTPTA